MIDDRLVSRIREALSSDEVVVFCTLRDPICVLPKGVESFLLTVILTMIAYSTWNVGFGLEILFPSTGIIARICIVAIAIIWVKCGLDTLNYNYEILAITKNKLTGPKAYYRKGFFLKKIAPIKLNSLASTPIDQSKHFYAPILGVGNLKLDVWGSDEGDIYFADCPRPFEVVQLINRLLAEKP